MSQITAAITEQVPVLAAIYADHFRACFAAVERWEAAHPRRSAWNDHFMCHDAKVASLVTRREGYGRMDDPKFLDEGKVARESQKQAEGIAAAYAAKVEGKAEGMEITEITRMDASGGFVIHGTKSGHAVRIVQSMVTKVSPRGTWFAQYPALVYIDSKKSTEKALHAL